MQAVADKIEHRYCRHRSANAVEIIEKISNPAADDAPRITERKQKL